MAYGGGNGQTSFASASLGTLWGRLSFQIRRPGAAVPRTKEGVARMPRRVVFLLLVGAVLAASVSVAWAINRSSTSVLIQRDPTFHGLVQSSDQCTPDRTVLLKIEKSDRDKTVGRTHTDAEGNWQ